MRLPFWLLAVPYVVTVSTSSILGGTTGWSLEPSGMACYADKKEKCDWIYDFAEALNQAHARRIDPDHREIGFHFDKDSVQVNTGAK